ncbi:MAG: hypothetical protein IKQ54_01440 [Oscillospiraceae bacterium]|nr:hypothetical protein [Oscillospiraceae bacterium]MBR4192979.1 hypothetical protein [Oscillospiraceae bacterium]
MVTLDKKQRRKEKKRGWWKLVPLLHAALFFGLYLLAILVYMKIWFNAPKLRFFFVPVVCLYYSMLAAIGYWFCTRTERLKERELMGDEWFFKTYPIERWLNRWNKWYRRRSLQRIKEIREKRMERERGRYWKPVERMPMEDWKRELILRGPELDKPKLKQLRKAEKQERAEFDPRREARKEAERMKYQRKLEAKMARELSKKGPDLPDSGFESWYETNPDKRQVIR